MSPTIRRADDIINSPYFTAEGDDIRSVPIISNEVGRSSWVGDDAERTIRVNVYK